MRCRGHGDVRSVHRGQGGFVIGSGRLGRRAGACGKGGERRRGSWPSSFMAWFAVLPVVSYNNHVGALGDETRGGREGGMKPKQQYDTL